MEEIAEVPIEIIPNPIVLENTILPVRINEDLSSIIDKENYFRDKYQKGFLKKDYTEIIDTIKESLQRIYPDLWDIRVKCYNKATNTAGQVGLLPRYVYFDIKFPSVIISNSKKFSIPLKNLFVRLPFNINENGIGMNTIQGMRTNVTVSEYENYYQHSHLSGSMNGKRVESGRLYFNNFCTGSGEINNIQMMINSELRRNIIDTKLFDLYLFHLSTFVSWESIEGVPYRRLGRVLQGNLSLSIIQREVVHNVYSAILRDTNFLKSIEWKIDKGVYKIIDNEDFEKSLVKYILNSCKTNKLTDGTYINTNRVTDKSKCFIDKTDYYLFRGEKYYFTVEEDIIKEDNIDISDVYPHPKITNYVRKRIEQYVNQRSIKNHTSGNKN